MNIQQSIKFPFIFTIHLKNLYNFDHLIGSNLKYHFDIEKIMISKIEIVRTAVVEIGQPQKTVKKMIDLLNKV